ncbi:hypothetical protein EMIT0P294_90153 [Pseudomonas sp. IT-P294]
MVRVQGPNIGRLFDDLYGLLHQINKKTVEQTFCEFFRTTQEQHSKGKVIAMCHLGTSQGTW